MSPQAYGWVLDHSESKGAARLVMVSIANHIDANTGEGWCYISTVLREANVSPASYRRAVQQCIESGELEREVNGGGSFKTKADARPNLFRFPVYLAARRGGQGEHPVRERPAQDEHPPPAQDEHPAGVSGCDPIAVTPLAVLDLSENPSRGDAFDAFWTAYPRKVAKPAARTAFARALKRTSAGTIMAGLERHRPGMESRIARGEPQFVCHPVTWLNQDRWDDDPPPETNGRARPSGSGSTRQVKPRDAWDDPDIMEDPFA